MNPTSLTILFSLSLFKIGLFFLRMIYIFCIKEQGPGLNFYGKLPQGQGRLHIRKNPSIFELPHLSLYSILSLAIKYAKLANHISPNTSLSQQSFLAAIHELQQAHKYIMIQNTSPISFTTSGSILLMKQLISESTQ